MQSNDKKERAKRNELKSIIVSIQLTIYCQYAFCISRSRYVIFSIRSYGRRRFKISYWQSLF